VYRIRWDESAIREILSQSAAADPDLQDAIIEASLNIDALLSERPEVTGESREPGVRVLIVNPITVRFHVNERLQEVAITSARIHERHSP
jgi:hypothetical protein